MDIAENRWFFEQANKLQDCRETLVKTNTLLGQRIKYILELILLKPIRKEMVNSQGQITDPTELLKVNKEGIFKSIKKSR